MSAAGERERPALRVVSGDATPEEIAAVLAVVAARGAGPPTGTSGATGSGDLNAWAAHGFAHRHVRAAFTPSQHGWRTSFWPR